VRWRRAARDSNPDARITMVDRFGGLPPFRVDRCAERRLRAPGYQAPPTRLDHERRSGTGSPTCARTEDTSSRLPSIGTGKMGMPWRAPLAAAALRCSPAEATTGIEPVCTACRVAGSVSLPVVTKLRCSQVPPGSPEIRSIGEPCGEPGRRSGGGRSRLESLGAGCRLRPGCGPVLAALCRDRELRIP
jgi:hypothetical protein